MGSNPSHFRGYPNQPVERVSWDEVQPFLRMLNELEEGRGYCLPTEAQWEYACRAGTEPSRYYPDINAITWYEGNSNGHPQPVGQKLPNTWGLYDMLGNVWEWCLDGQRKYKANAVVDPMGQIHAGVLGKFLGRAGDLRVFRGGSWIDSSQGIRAAIRRWDTPGNHFANLGFRCACSVRRR
jgi:formylglycine-generating enzyme required for sulfatase activity